MSRILYLMQRETHPLTPVAHPPLSHTTLTATESHPQLRCRVRLLAACHSLLNNLKSDWFYDSEP